MDSEQAETRCASLWQSTRGDVVRCDRWADHSEQMLHHGYGSGGLECVWSSKDEVKIEDRRLGQEPCEALRECERYANLVVGERDDWERAVDDLTRANLKLVKERDLEATVGAQLERVLREVNRERDRYKRERDEAQREARAVRDQMSAEDRERLEMGRELARAREYISKLDASNHRLVDEGDQAQRDLASQDTQIHELQQEVARARERISELEAGGDLPLSRARIEELERWLKYRRDRIAALEDQLENQADVIRRQRGEMQQMLAEKSEGEDKLANFLRTRGGRRAEA